ESTPQPGLEGSGAWLNVEVGHRRHVWAWKARSSYQRRSARSQPRGRVVSETSFEEEPEERSELELTIDEQIALLSQASETPSEFEPPGRAFDAGEVDLRSP